MVSPKIILAPSILAGDHGCLVDSLKTIAAFGLKWAHLDIMDGHFVPNFTFGPQTVADLRPHSDLFFDTHLMLDEPYRYIEDFAKAGSNLISIHVEPDYPIGDTLAEIRKLGCQNGIVFNPATPVEAVLPYLHEVDLVLAMTVVPGFGGQSFHEEVLIKIKSLYDHREKENLSYRIEVDGGVNEATAQLCKQAGCDTLVAGTAFFGSNKKTAFIDSIKKIQ